MGAFWSKKGNQFERVLEKLEKNITSLEGRQKTAQLNKRRFMAYLIYGVVVTELIVVSWYYLHRKPKAVLERIIDASPLLVPLLVGFILRAIITFYYTKRLKHDEIKLTRARSQLKLKLDERRQATEFDTTQQLLSKYERFTKNEETPSSPKAGGSKKSGSQIHKRPGHVSPTSAPPPPFNNPVRPPGAPVPPGGPAPPGPGPVPVPPGGQVNPNIAHPSNPPPVPQGMPQRKVAAPPLQHSRSWMDKLVDFVVGGDPQHSIALICGNCKGHNGLIPQSEMQSIQFRCRFCNFFNQNGEAPTPAPTPAPAPAPAAPASPVPSSSKQQSPKQESKKSK